MKTMLLFICPLLLVFSGTLTGQEQGADPNAILYAGVETSVLELYLKKFPPNLAKKSLLVHPLDLPNDPNFRPLTMRDLPPFENDMEKKVTKTGKVHRNGNLTTINFEAYPERVNEGISKITIPAAATGFPGDISARLFMQPGKAPLAVPLLGFGMSASSKSAQSYQHDLIKAGNHVLCTDSIVTNEMNEATGLGVAGFALPEAQATAKIVDAFLASTNPETGKPYREQVSTVRILGTSWGGMLALTLLRLPQAKTWPIDRCLVVSVPVNLRHTALRLDKFHREDRNRVGLFKMAKLQKGYSPKEADPSPGEDVLMRAGVGFVFHGDLKHLAEGNIKRYSPDLPQRLEAFENDPETLAARKQNALALKQRHEREIAELKARKGQLGDDAYDHARKELEDHQKMERDYVQRKLTSLADWSFKHYAFLLLRPFYGVRGDVSDIGNLDVLLKGAPNWLQVVVAADDPLNQPEDLQAVMREYTEPTLLVTPHGGHLGLNGTQWFQVMMAKFFATK